MSERPTPETDAAWSCFKGYMEPLQDVKDLSRKLERERDEAREALKKCREDSIDSDYTYEDWRKMGNIAGRRRAVLEETK